MKTFATLISIVSLIAIINCVGCYENSSKTRSETNRINAKREKENHENRMIRQVGAIQEDIGDVELKIRDSYATLVDEKTAYVDAKSNARQMYITGQMTDFRIWQRIGKEKHQNITEIAEKCERTIAQLPNLADSQLQQVSWTSSQARTEHSNRINTQISAIKTWSPKLKNARSEIANCSWLNYRE